MTEMNFRNVAAVVTGAGSGIGAALSKGLAARGARLALVDREAERLEETRAALPEDARVTLHPMDVTDLAAVRALPGAVEAAHGGASFLFNNAGIALGGTFEELTEVAFDLCLATNLHAPIQMTRAFLPLLRQAPEARIVNVSSLFGLIAPAGQTAYSASKFGLRGFSESLRHELAGTNVGVTVVHPGGVKTRIARDAMISEAVNPIEAALQMKEFEEKSLKMSPEDAARRILDGVARRRGRLVIGGDAKFISFVQRLFPESYSRMLSPFFPQSQAD